MESVNGGSAADRLSVGIAQGIWKAFGETQALRDVSLDVETGECHGLVGRNGAGKSTLVAILTGLIRPDRGVVRLGTEAAPLAGGPRHLAAPGRVRLSEVDGGTQPYRCREHLPQSCDGG